MIERIEKNEEEQRKLFVIIESFQTEMNKKVNEQNE